MTIFTDASLNLDGSILGFGYQYLGSVGAPNAPAGNTMGGAQVNCGPVTFKAAPLYSDGIFGSTWNVRFVSSPSCVFTVDYQTGGSTSYEVSKCIYNAEVGDGTLDFEYEQIGGGIFGGLYPFSFEVQTPESCVPCTFTVDGGPVRKTLPVTVPVGVHTVVWNTIDQSTCEPLQVVENVTVQDLEAPVFNPACPKKVIINLGPGVECEGVWDAPPFSAIDNCPSPFVNGDVFVK